MWMLETTVGLWLTRECVTTQATVFFFREQAVLTVSALCKSPAGGVFGQGGPMRGCLLACLWALAVWALSAWKVFLFQSFLVPRKGILSGAVDSRSAQIIAWAAHAIRLGSD